jgi:S1-C subfamily serine protease
MFHLFRVSLITCIFFCFGFFATIVSAAGDDAYKAIFKLKAYSRDTISGNYSFSHYGSAVLVDANHIVTNAHVVLDEDGIAPTGYYEVCKSENTKKVPTCFSVAKLVSYDAITDLAILELPTALKDIRPVTFSDTKDMSVASVVVVYGYPAIGGYTITRTEGKIGGSDGDKYKFDGTIDHGNSGG